MLEINCFFLYFVRLYCNITITDYMYEYDEAGNWVKRTTKYSDSTEQVETREISYY